MNRADILIIGGGWSGILACKYAIEAGFGPIVLEKRESFGGVWRFSDNPAIVTVMKTTETTSSSTVTEMSDYFMPDEYGNFPKHDQVLEYLNSFGNKFRIWKHFRFNEEVIDVRKRDALWQVTTNQDIYQSKFIIIASGVHQIPNLEPMYDIFSNFSGTLQHSIQIKEIVESYHGKNILVYGGGETASDIIELLADHANRLVMSIPNGQHFFQKRKKPISPFFDWFFVPGNYGEPLDKATSLLIRLISPPIKSKPGMAWGCRKTCGKSIFSYQGHGIPQWRSKNKFLHAFVNKNAAPVELAQKGRLIPKAGVKKVEGKSITFVDGDVLEFDVVIACTGYREDLSFLDVELNKEIQNLYKYIFNPYDETMAFAGLIRPVLLSIPGLAEQQIKSIMKVWTGDVRLPENADMINAAKQERKYWDEFFKDSSRRIKNLVEGYAYTNDLFKTFGFYPNLKKLMLRNPKLLVYALTSPYHAAFSLLNNPECDRRVYRTLKKHTSFGWQTTPFGLVFTRLLQVDRISDCVANIKYRRQLKDLKEKTNYRKPA